MEGDAFKRERERRRRGDHEERRREDTRTKQTEPSHLSLRPELSHFSLPPPNFRFQLLPRLSSASREKTQFVIFDLQVWCEHFEAARKGDPLVITATDAIHIAGKRGKQKGPEEMKQKRRLNLKER
ncbi:unnamed protein product [Camellia sinensis]